MVSDVEGSSSDSPGRPVPDADQHSVPDVGAGFDTRPKLDIAVAAAPLPVPAACHHLPPQRFSDGGP